VATPTLFRQTYRRKNAAGQDVLVNQVGCYGIHLGRIDFYFDSNKQNIAKGKAIVV